MKMKRSAHKKFKLRGWKLLAALYLALLALSHAWQIINPPEFPPAPGQKVVHLPDPAAKNPFAIAYYDVYTGKPATGQPQAGNPPVVLLLHGSPVGNEMLHGFISGLAKHARVIAPDIPGYGASNRDLGDYSFRAQARWLLQFLRELELQQVHVAAYSMGGAVALEMAGLEPQRFSSLAMLSGLGVQEAELLGDYHLNHALHGMQLALIWLLQEATPHFGALDHFPLNLPYARNFFDSDQRPLRRILQQFQAPMLILHGEADGLVPLAAAKEHYRIAPQSEMLLYPDGHLLIMNRSGEMAEEIGRFIARVERGEARTRAEADPRRIAEAEAPFVQVNIPKAEGITLFVFMLLIALATLASEDLACIGAGLMAARGAIDFLPAAVAALAGIVGGDMLLYLAGKFLGRPALRYPPLKWVLGEEDIARTARWFAARGPKIVLVSRFLPGSRLPTYFGAGVLGMGFGKFSFYFLLAAALWTPLVVGLATLVGGEILKYYHVFKTYALPVLLFTALLIWGVIKLGLPLFSFRGRRLLLAALRRRVRWEFWPRWAFYPPVVLYALYLGIRYRGLAIFTAANPAIPAGGFVGELKSQILQGLHAAGDRVARWRVISRNLPGEERLRQLRRFMAEENLTFPVVLKPDAGERGEGVAIIRSEPEAQRYLTAARQDTIAQEYVAGREFGVFYYRYPGEGRGRIFSITDKRLLTLTGDGASSFEELILKDQRAMCMAPFHFRKHRQRLYEIPPAGEEIQLVEVGTHCRGALFLDGNGVLTPELEAAIDRISRGFAGFYFGRYDILTPNLEGFKQGKNFKIVELNGVTSEATHIYDPGNSLFKAYRTLMKQWKIAYEIGAANREQGVKPASLRELARLLMGRSSR